MDRGYVALWRKIVDHPFSKEKRVFSKYEAWIDILMEVQHSEKPTDFVIGMSVLKCNYAESLKSVLTWSRRWNWSESKVRRYFKLLKKMDQISSKSEGKTTRIKVLNYSQYDLKRRKNELKPSDTRRIPEGQPSTDKNEKNENNEKNVKTTPSKTDGDDIFEKFWKMYGKPVEKKKCRSKWNRIKSVDQELIFKNLPAYVQATPDRQYRKNPSTYLNNECWNDEIIKETKNGKTQHNYTGIDNRPSVFPERDLQD